MDPLLTPGRIGSLELRTRLVRAGTSETMATEWGGVTDELVALYERLARSGLGLLLTGHLYCHPRGQYARRQTGIWSDEHIPGLKRLTDAVHRHGVPILAQVSHAGSQSRVPDNEPLAPSPVPNALTGRDVGEATEAELEEAIAMYAAGARRAIEAGFDGVHVHGANGYLISELSSPLTNRRTDGWGGSATARDRFVRQVVRGISAAIGDAPLTVKLGMVDAVPGGLGLEESVPRARALVEDGADAIEISVNVMKRATDSARQYVAVDSRRAAEDLLVHRLGKPPADEAYFVPWARRAREVVDVPLIVAGGMRTTETIRAVLERGDADFVAMARPLIREPDLAAQIEAGREGRVDCTSCNICLMHEGYHALRCWRTPRRRLVAHAALRLAGRTT
jgi:2,4-dienoyl-CoA reductase-like NADH-dependent reductase (Old Yellow Enzyme family)